jgi:hypothetical protein
MLTMPHSLLDPSNRSLPAAGRQRAGNGLISI